MTKIHFADEVGPSGTQTYVHPDRSAATAPESITVSSLRDIESEPSCRALWREGTGSQRAASNAGAGEGAAGEAGNAAAGDGAAGAGGGAAGINGNAVDPPPPGDPPPSDQGGAGGR